MGFSEKIIMIRKILLLMLVVTVMQVEQASAKSKSKGNLNLKFDWKRYYNWTISKVSDLLSDLVNVIYLYDYVSGDDELENVYENETAQNEKVEILVYLNKSTGRHTYVRVIHPLY